jgi:NAD(P)H-dependent FMN reductase
MDGIEGTKVPKVIIYLELIQIYFMKKVLVVIGSAREGRAATKVADFVAAELTALGAEPTMADLAQLNMPFFNNAKAPASEDFSTAEPSVLAWSKMVKESDAVVILTPEYNHGTSAILKNAIDWLFGEWVEKPVQVIGYGWSGGTFAIANVTESLTHLKAAVQRDSASLFFMKSIGLDGEPMGDEAKLMLEPVLKELLEG